MKKLCILVPYRDREEHKKVFLEKMIPMLESEKKIEDFTIAFIEQSYDSDKLFNRGMLLNVGYDLLKDSHDYFIFHDVDMIPTSVSSYLFNENENAIHLATNASQFAGSTLPYYEYFGGVTLFNKDAFLDINGFSNDYWGWGCEDDDLLRRTINKNIKVFRRQTIITSLSHKSNEFNDEGLTNPHVLKNKSLFRKRLGNNDFGKEGLNTLVYKVNKKEELNEKTLIINVTIKKMED